LLNTFVEHFDAIVLFDLKTGEVVFQNRKFKQLFSKTINTFFDLEEEFIEQYKSAQTPIFNTLNVNGVKYLVKRKKVKDYLLYHFERNNYYSSMIDNIKREATIDELTKCYNRKEFNNILARMLSSSKRYQGSNFAMIMFDLDHFKNINDRYGHLAGDYVLKELSELVRFLLRDSDIFARVGGEEFMIILPQTKLHGALKTAQKLRSYIENYKFKFNSVVIPVTISLGITSIMLNDDSFTILDRVDKALYKAKETGRNKVEYL